jgi:hypothetical protein
MTRLARTLALRRCSGCERVLGVSLWVWSGHYFVTTHGLCTRCLGETARLAHLGPGVGARRRTRAR